MLETGFRTLNPGFLYALVPSAYFLVPSALRAKRCAD
jgi:hypothetical protein